jgi:TonB-dependent SusC/RagA subfamily outer membrane receptor
MQKLQLTIPEPCHENWQNMTPTDQGRFCNACAKEVIDFSTMTDIQVLNYFTNITNEKVCGRALPEQLDRTLSRPAQPKKRLFWYWNYIVMFFMFFAKGNSAKAQGGIKPVTECSPVKGKSEVITVAGYAVRRTSQTITGKVTDKDGNPVAFASVKIKGTNTGTIADANGAYSLKVNSNAMLVISGASFKDAEVPVGTQKFLNTVMEKSGIDIKEVFVTTAICTRRTPRSGTSAVKTIEVNPKIVFEVKEDNTGLPIGNAAIIITRKGDNLSDKILSDNKGIYKFTEIKMNESYFIKVVAAGYEPNEFTIDAKDIKDREKAWEVLLKKQNNQLVKTTGIAISKTEKPIRMMGSFSVVSKDKGPIYVVDGTIITDGVNLKPEDIEHIEVLQSPAAAALFGPEGANGAIIITARKAKEISLKEVVVRSDYDCKRTTRGGMSYTYTYEDSFLGDTIATLKTLLNSSIKVYPNPVQRNTVFSVALKLKQAGNYSMQVTDASGRIFLQQKFNANSKDHTEKIMGDSRWAAGVYYIRVFDNKNQLISKTSFIFE